jgi:hypothetical protein
VTTEIKRKFLERQIAQRIRLASRAAGNGHAAAAEREQFNIDILTAIKADLEKHHG